MGTLWFQDGDHFWNNFLLPLPSKFWSNNSSTSSSSQLPLLFLISANFCDEYFQIFSQNIFIHLQTFYRIFSLPALSSKCRHWFWIFSILCTQYTPLLFPVSTNVSFCLKYFPCVEISLGNVSKVPFSIIWNTFMFKEMKPNSQLTFFCAVFFPPQRVALTCASWWSRQST